MIVNSTKSSIICTAPDQMFLSDRFKAHTVCGYGAVAGPRNVALFKIPYFKDTISFRKTIEKQAMCYDPALN